MKHAFIITLCASRIAAAQPASAQAEVLYREALKLLDDGKIAEACTSFDASQRLEPSLSTLFQLAQCRERNNQLATAWGLFLELERKTRATDDERVLRAHTTAAEAVARLEPRLSTLKIVVPADAAVRGLEIKRNGEVVDAGALNKALPVDGGSYTISAHAPGNADWTTTLAIENERDAKSIEVPKLREVLPEPKPAVTAPAPVAARRRSLTPYYIGAGGVLALGGALALELHARSTYRDATSASTLEVQRDHWHSANHQRYAAEAFGVAGLATIGLALWLGVRDRGEHVSLTATADHVGVTLQGGF